MICHIITQILAPNKYYNVATCGEGTWLPSKIRFRTWSIADISKLSHLVCCEMNWKVQYKNFDNISLIPLYNTPTFIRKQNIEGRIHFTHQPTTLQQHSKRKHLLCMRQFLMHAFSKNPPKKCSRTIVHYSITKRKEGNALLLL